jgi:two-component system, LytTR family, response regulator
MKTPKIEVICVDDLQIELARFEMAMQGFEDAFLKACFSSVDEAIEYCTQTPPDLAVIDIEMPGRGGIWLASKLNDLGIPFAFLSSHTAYGIEAYELQAIHYLQKPVTKNGLAELFRRYRELVPVLSASPDMAVEDSKEIPRRIYINTQKQMLVVQLSDIVFISADGSYTHFHLLNGTSIVSGKTMKTYAGTVLRNPDFAQIHRTYIINQAHLVMINKKKLEMSFKFSNNQEIKVATFRKGDWFNKIG